MEPRLKLSMWGNFVVAGFSPRPQLFGLFVLKRVPVAELHGFILSAARAVLKRMCSHGNLVAGFNAVCFPALCSDLRNGAHFERPFDILTGCRIGGYDVEPAVWIGPFKGFQSTRYCDQLFLIEHCKRMVSCGLTGKHGNDSDNSC